MELDAVLPPPSLPGLAAVAVAVAVAVAAAGCRRSAGGEGRPDLAGKAGSLAPLRPGSYPARFGCARPPRTPSPSTLSQAHTRARAAGAEAEAGAKAELLPRCPPHWPGPVAQTSPPAPLIGNSWHPSARPGGAHRGWNGADPNGRPGRRPLLGCPLPRGLMGHPLELPACSGPQSLTTLLGDWGLGDPPVARPGAPQEKPLEGPELPSQPDQANLPLARPGRVGAGEMQKETPPIGIELSVAPGPKRSAPQEKGRGMRAWKGIFLGIFLTRPRLP